MSLISNDWRNSTSAGASLRKIHKLDFNQEIDMRKAAITVMMLSVLISTPFIASAQQDERAARTQQTTDREDHGEWGWLGLLGLVGLLGLKRRDRDHVVTGERATTAR
jgi:MYXO-CTERM domain-containing protein